MGAGGQSTSAEWARAGAGVRALFQQLGYVEEGHAIRPDGELIWFSRGGKLHSVWHLPARTVVTKGDVAACYQAQLRLGAAGSSLVAPRRFSPAAIALADLHGIVLRRFDV